MKSRMINGTKKSIGRTEYPLAVLLCCLSSMSCVSPERHRQNPDLAKDDLSVYRITNDQAGHEFVKTEKFLVPVGSVIVIKGLEFEPGASALTLMHKHIVQQVFNSIEEITENTVGDTNSTRVAEYRKMEFEIHGYSDDSGNRGVDGALAEERAKAVLNLLSYLGTPPWRLKGTGVIEAKRQGDTKSTENLAKHGTVEFLRTR